MSKQKILSKVHLNIHVGIKASKTEVRKYQDSVLWVTLKAVPEKGEANDELIRFLSEWLSLPKSQISLIRGKTSRQKTVELLMTDDDKENLRLLLAGLS